MGWREVLLGVIDEGCWVSGCNSRECYAEVTADEVTIVRKLLEMPPADRIALARELLAGTGRFVAKQYEQVVGEFSNGGKIVQTVLVADYPETTAEPTP